MYEELLSKGIKLGDKRREIIGEQGTTMEVPDNLSEIIEVNRARLQYKDKKGIQIDIKFIKDGNDWKPGVEAPQFA